MNIAFFLVNFPVLSETFVLRQIAGLVQSGNQVTVITGDWGDRNVSHEIYKKFSLQNRVLAIRDMDLGSSARLWLLVRFIFKSILSTQGWLQLKVSTLAFLNGSKSTLLDIASLSIKNKSLGDYDVIIAHFGPAGVRAMYLQQAGLLDGAIVTIFHGNDMSDRSIVAQQLINYKKLFKNTALLLPISLLWRNRLIEWGANPEKIKVLRMGVDLDKLLMGPINRPINEPLKILSVARFTEKKGLAYAIEGVCTATCNIEYRIVGSGPLENELKRLAMQAPRGKVIKFLGPKPHQEIFEELEQSDVFLLPSVTASSGDMEGIPVALMEAMAKGVVVLSTFHSGIPELIQDKYSGFLVPEKDPVSIGKKLDEIANGQYELNRIRQRAQEKINLEFNNSILDSQLLSICHGLIKD